MIRTAAGLPGSQARDALGELYQLYWPPLFAFLRRLGYESDRAEDLLQGFVARMIEKNTFQHFQKERGRFRSFLLASLKHFLSNEHAAADALKPGGAQAAVPLEDAGMVRDDRTPDRVFEKRWALDLIQRATQRLQREYQDASKGPLFEQLKPYLSGDAEGVPYREAADAMGMNEGALKVAVHRFRQRFHEALRAEVADTVTHTEDVGDEIRYLLTAIQGQ